MSDLLVPLYKLPERMPLKGFAVRRVMAHEGVAVRKWVEAEFSSGWASEILPALSRTPSSIFIAVDGSSQKPAGFCAWDCTALGFLGPVGVAENYRNRGLGRRLTVEVLYSMKEQGYGYAVVGDAGPVEFFKSSCSAIIIPDSAPGIYPEVLT
ncbi:MAG: GNAT family N-acetyltransferase [Candidatus Fermentibacteraceae bacterium]|nr:GNAT family N-acetyltransferase [Candidatus Fermentibacteraceae bacterium]